MVGLYSIRMTRGSFIEKAHILDSNSTGSLGNGAKEPRDPAIANGSSGNCMSIEISLGSMCLNGMIWGRVGWRLLARESLG